MDWKPLCIRHARLDCPACAGAPQPPQPAAAPAHEGRQRAHTRDPGDERILAGLGLDEPQLDPGAYSRLLRLLDATDHNARAARARAAKAKPWLRTADLARAEVYEAWAGQLRLALYGADGSA